MISIIIIIINDICKAQN